MTRLQVAALFSDLTILEPCSSLTPLPHDSRRLFQTNAVAAAAARTDNRRVNAPLCSCLSVWALEASEPFTTTRWESRTGKFLQGRRGRVINNWPSSSHHNFEGSEPANGLVIRRLKPVTTLQVFPAAETIIRGWERNWPIIYIYTRRVWCFPNYIHSSFQPSRRIGGNATYDLPRTSPPFRTLSRRVWFNVRYTQYGL